MKRMTIDLEDELKRELDIYCATIQMNKSDVIRQWIKEKLEEEKKKKK
jgi:metal-responsive CopG/Arc/MetJ family transcriptional regulator